MKKPKYTDVAPKYHAQLDEVNALRRKANQIYSSVLTQLIGDIRSDMHLEKEDYCYTLALGCCTGKYGTCIYDIMEDPSMDLCLICQEPYERK
jgi:hypothetical protein